jgi:hypothetical protein
LTAATLLVVSCEGFDARPVVVYDPATGKWVVTAEITPVTPEK